MNFARTIKRNMKKREMKLAGIEKVNKRLAKVWQDEEIKKIGLLNYCWRFNQTNNKTFILSPDEILIRHSSI